MGQRALSTGRSAPRPPYQKERPRPRIRWREGRDVSLALAAPRAELLGVVHLALLVVSGDADADLVELVAEDMFAVLGRVHPALDDLVNLDALVADGDVLAHAAVVVAGPINALGRVLAVE